MSKEESKKTILANAVIRVLPTVWFPISAIVKQVPFFDFLVVTTKTNSDYGNFRFWGWVLTACAVIGQVWIMYKALMRTEPHETKKTIDKLKTDNAFAHDLIDFHNALDIKLQEAFESELELALENHSKPKITELFFKKQLMSFLIDLCENINAVWFSEKSANLNITLAYLFPDSTWKWLRPPTTELFQDPNELAKNPNSTFSRCQRTVDRSGLIFFNDKIKAAKSRNYVYDEIEDNKTADGSILCQYDWLNIGDGKQIKMVISVSSNGGKFIANDNKGNTRKVKEYWQFYFYNTRRVRLENCLYGMYLCEMNSTPKRLKKWTVKNFSFGVN